jgi:membrane-associated protein
MLPGFELRDVLETAGALIAFSALFGIIFAESGLFFGFFLPGDSLLLTAGVLSAAEPQLFPLWLVCAGCFVAAVVGDAVGYTFGYRVGRRLYERPDSRFFKRSHLLAAEAFYRKHGGKTIVIARFLPFVRTFAPIVAGAARMPYPRFALFNFTGALLWAIGLPVAGYLLGTALGETLDRYLLLVLAVVVALSVLPTAIHVYRSNREEIHARVRSRGKHGAPPRLSGDEAAD